MGVEPTNSAMDHESHDTATDNLTTTPSRPDWYILIGARYVYLSGTGDIGIAHPTVMLCCRTCYTVNWQVLD